MFKSKRNGVELSMNLIIIAVISLLVLLLLAFFLSGGFSNWNKNTKCESQGGSCLGSCTTDKPVLSPFTCDGKEICCTKSAIGG